MLEIYSVATGRLLREWTTMDSFVFLDSFTAPGLTWIDSDRAIAFPVIIFIPKREVVDITLEAVRSVDVAAPGGDLISHSRVIWSATAARAVGPLWANATGSTLIGGWLVAVRPPNPPREVIHFGVIRHGTFTPMPIPAALLTEPQLSSPMW